QHPATVPVPRNPPVPGPRSAPAPPSPAPPSRQRLTSGQGRRDADPPRGRPRPPQRLPRRGGDLMIDDTARKLTIRELVAGEDTYRVPEYQRNYAWTATEITQLISDVRLAHAAEQSPF